MQMPTRAKVTGTAAAAVRITGIAGVTAASGRRQPRPGRSGRRLVKVTAQSINHEWRTGVGLGLGCNSVTSLSPGPADATPGPPGPGPRMQLPGRGSTPGPWSDRFARLLLLCVLSHTGSGWARSSPSHCQPECHGRSGRRDRGSGDSASASASLSDLPAGGRNGPSARRTWARYHDD